MRMLTMFQTGRLLSHPKSHPSSLVLRAATSPLTSSATPTTLSLTHAVTVPSLTAKLQRSSPRTTPACSSTLVSQTSPTPITASQCTITTVAAYLRITPFRRFHWACFRAMRLASRRSCRGGSKMRSRISPWARIPRSFCSSTRLFGLRIRSTFCMLRLLRGAIILFGSPSQRKASCRAPTSFLQLSSVMSRTASSSRRMKRQKQRLWRFSVKCSLMLTFRNLLRSRTPAGLLSRGLLEVTQIGPQVLHYWLTRICGLTLDDCGLRVRLPVPSTLGFFMELGLRVVRQVHKLRRCCKAGPVCNTEMIGFVERGNIMIP